MQHLHKFHKRVIWQLPPDCETLAEGNEIIQSRSKQILSFQSHPEMDERISRGILASEASYRSSFSTKAFEKVEHSQGLEHDGQFAFNTALRWAFSS